MNITEIMSTLQDLGASPRRSFGQNFLHDKNIAAWIVGKLDLTPVDQVIEIGSGLGALTEEILHSGVSATLLEKDKAFAGYLRKKFAHTKIDVIEGDALEYDTRGDFLRQPAKLVGNLPYYASSQLLFHFCAEPCPYDRMVLTVQKEMADRLSASRGTKEYGSLSVIVQHRWRVAKLKTLSPSVFLPRPRVDSAVLLMTRREPGELEEVDSVRFAEVVRAGFSKRRKQVRNSLNLYNGSNLIQEVLSAVNLPPTVRAEDISLEKWIKIVNILRPSVVYGANPNERLTVVDENDRALRPLDRKTIHRENLYHRAAHVFIFNRLGELFLQKRSHRKENFPRRWDSSAAGHVDAGEGYMECAIREVGEEIGLNCSLSKIGAVPASERTGNEFIEIFRANSNVPLSLNVHEIETGGFFSLPMIDRWIAERPSDFAPGFVECYQAVRHAL
ncbi:MAG TPA: 16S rRNA (adenine(1518)-N(6)/adenine(1519)-N(6))-dimethyltransferase RsmA [Chthoniobacterales bacterium]|jgi:16S rRNA (adenine1518-N6/adenine1519-N6)-dimethyltransferase|nr:16S rRNA (adenine(1518)-N(6)/adenine(1519)-N(6))-dimethyltransferase RsmA [Chthoniobacterales bacterium]